MDKIIQQEIDKLIEKRKAEIESYKTMFNEGNNNGDITIVCKDKEVKVHSEVLRKHSEYYRNCEQTFDSEKKLCFNEYNNNMICPFISILYESTYDKVYYSASQTDFFDFFEFADILLLDSIMDERMKEICNIYITNMKRGIYVNHKPLPDLYWFHLLSGMNYTNKYFKIFVDELINIYIQDIAKSYITHYITHKDNKSKNNKYMCGNSEYNCVFDKEKVSLDIMRLMKKAACKYILEKLNSK